MSNIHTPRCWHAWPLACQRFFIALAALALLAGTAAAAPVSLAFSGSGAVTGPAQAFPVLSGLSMISATSDYIVDGDDGWHVEKSFGFNVATLTGGGSFTLSDGIDSLSGTFTSSRASSTAPTDLFYTVTGGSGRFAGFVGTGVASGATVGNAFGLPTAAVSFRESGVFNVSAVPEPTTGLLLMAGLAALVLRPVRRVAARGRLAKLVCSTALLGGAAIGGQALAQAAPDPIEGVWEAVVTQRDCASSAVLTTFQGTLAFHRGGAMSDTSGVAPTSRSPGFGNWSGGAGAYAAKFRFFRYNADGTLAGTAVAMRTISLAADGNSWTSTVRTEIRSLAGAVLQTVCATDTSTRFR